MAQTYNSELFELAKRKLRSNRFLVVLTEKRQRSQSGLLNFGKKYLQDHGLQGLNGVLWNMITIDATIDLLEDFCNKICRVVPVYSSEIDPYKIRSEYKKVRPDLEQILYQQLEQTSNGLNWAFNAIDALKQVNLIAMIDQLDLDWDRHDPLSKKRLQDFFALLEKEMYGPKPLPLYIILHLSVDFFENDNARLWLKNTIGSKFYTILEDSLLYYDGHDNVMDAEIPSVPKKKKPTKPKQNAPSSPQSETPIEAPKETIKEEVVVPPKPDPTPIPKTALAKACELFYNKLSDSDTLVFQTIYTSFYIKNDLSTSNILAKACRMQELSEASKQPIALLAKLILDADEAGAQTIYWDGELKSKDCELRIGEDRGEEAALQLLEQWPRLKDWVSALPVTPQKSKTSFKEDAPKEVSEKIPENVSKEQQSPPKAAKKKSLITIKPKKKS